MKVYYRYSFKRESKKNVPAPVLCVYPTEAIELECLNRIKEPLSYLADNAMGYLSWAADRKLLPWGEDLLLFVEGRLETEEKFYPLANKWVFISEYEFRSWELKSPRKGGAQKAEIVMIPLPAAKVKINAPVQKRTTVKKPASQSSLF